MTKHVYEPDGRELGTIMPVRGAWQASTRAGIILGRFLDEGAARAALQAHVHRHRETLAVRGNDYASARFDRTVKEQLDARREARSRGDAQ